MRPYYQNKRITIYSADCIDCLKELQAESVQTCITSPPYFGLRDYGVDGQIGKEETPEVYVEKLVAVFREVWRVLKKDGTLWLNLGDSYAGSGKGSNPDGLKPKDLIGIPWRVAFALQSDGWYLRQDIIWHKPNPMPESVTDRCTKAHEYIFLLSKSQSYYYDSKAIKEDTVTRDHTIRDRDTTKLNNTPGRSRSGGLVGNDYEKRNKRSVWTVATAPYRGSHFAAFPRDLITPCILAGCPIDGVVIDPFSGSGTTALVAMELGRNAIGIELNREYCGLRVDEFSQSLCF